MPLEGHLSEAEPADDLRDGVPLPPDLCENLPAALFIHPLLGNMFLQLDNRSRQRGVVVPQCHDHVTVGLGQTVYLLCHVMEFIPPAEFEPNVQVSPGDLAEPL